LAPKRKIEQPILTCLIVAEKSKLDALVANRDKQDFISSIGGTSLFYFCLYFYTFLLGEGVGVLKISNLDLALETCIWSSSLSLG
jgi:hypothetical protein